MVEEVKSFPENSPKSELILFFKVCKAETAVLAWKSFLSPPDAESVASVWPRLLCEIPHSPEECGSEEHTQWSYCPCGLCALFYCLCDGVAREQRKDGCNSLRQQLFALPVFPWTEGTWGGLLLLSVGTWCLLRGNGVAEGREPHSGLVVGQHPAPLCLHGSHGEARAAEHMVLAELRRGWPW